MAGHWFSTSSSSWSLSGRLLLKTITCFGLSRLHFVFWGENALQHSDIGDGPSARKKKFVAIVYSSHNRTCHAASIALKFVTVMSPDLFFFHVSQGRKECIYSCCHLDQSLFCMFSLLHHPVVCTCKTWPSLRCSPATWKIRRASTSPSDGNSLNQLIISALHRQSELPVCDHSRCEGITPGASWLYGGT